MKYPPFCDIILIRFSGTDLNEIVKASNIYYKNLKRYFGKDNGMVFEPVPAPIDKIKSKFRWRIVVKGKVNSSMLEALNRSFAGIENVKNTSIQIDINPSSMM